MFSYFLTLFLLMMVQRHVLKLFYLKKVNICKSNTKQNRIKNFEKTNFICQKRKLNQAKWWSFFFFFFATKKILSSVRSNQSNYMEEKWLVTSDNVSIEIFQRGGSLRRNCLRQDNTIAKRSLNVKLEFWFFKGGFGSNFTGGFFKP